MVSLPGTAWLRFVIWLGIGLVIYTAYGFGNNILAREHNGQAG
jgi:hypothetical protein